MRLKFGFSNSVNDTYMFEAMVNGRIDTEGLSFETVVTDIENLDKTAIHDGFDMVRISFATYPSVSERYQILDTGSLMGFANGPVVVSKKILYCEEIESLQIAIPGFHTTAWMLLSIAYPNCKNIKEFLFSEIEDAVLNNKVDAGLVSREQRLTYERKGLNKIIDLGAWWEGQTGLPIPMGGIVVKRSLPQTTKQIINRVINNSITFANEHKRVSLPFVKQFNPHLDEDEIKQHIELYINEFSNNMGTTGRLAIERLFERSMDIRKINYLTQPIFAI